MGWRMRWVKVHNAFGFSLLEVMVCLTILAIIMLVAIPSYNYQIMHARRADAMQSLHRLYELEYAYKLKNGASAAGTEAQICPSGMNACGLATTYYTYSLVTGGGSVSITATAIGSQANDNVQGQNCGVMTIGLSGGTATSFTPSYCLMGY